MPYAKAILYRSGCLVELLVLDPGEPNGKIEIIGRLLSPVSAAEVGTIRCIGLNVSLTRRCGQMEGPRSKTLGLILT